MNSSNRNGCFKPVHWAFVGPLWLIPSTVKLIDVISLLLQLNTSTDFHLCDLNVLANINEAQLPALR